MISKNIVLSMIVIGCLVQFITCPPPAGNTNLNKPLQTGASKPSSGNSSQSKHPQGAKKSGVSSATKTGVQARELQDLSPNNNGQVKDPKFSAKKQTGLKEPLIITPDNQNINIDNIPENEELKDGKSKGPIKRAFKMFNRFRKKFCPFRLFGKVVKKTREVGTNMFGTVMNTIKPKSTNDNNSDE